MITFDAADDISFANLCCSPRERELFDAACETLPSGTTRSLGRVVRLDRGFPLVCCEEGLYRAEHAVSLIKTTDSLSCVGDWVVLALPQGHDMAIIEKILPRKQSFSRKDPSEKTGAQTLAANIDVIFVLHALTGGALNARRLEREMVVAHESGATPVVVLTKADLATSLEEDLQAAHAAVPGVEVIVESTKDGRGIDTIRARIPQGTTAVLLGSSGVGKSSLVNALLGAQRQETGAVREGDDKGRHTTVAREMLAVPGGGVIIDTPGIRSLALWDSDAGVALSFPEVAAAADGCKFRDCTHTKEPGCAVIAAVEAGAIESRRLDSYRDLMAEMTETEQRREERQRLDKKKTERRSVGDIKRHYNVSGKDKKNKL